jgi:hypothetical protein
MSSHVLVPYDRREGMTLRDAAKLAGKSEGTVRTWCQQHDIGRRVAGGPWCVSTVALAMLLDGNADALAAYLAGDRHGPLVASYYERLGLGGLLRTWQPSQDQIRTERFAPPDLRPKPAGAR